MTGPGNLLCAKPARFGGRGMVAFVVYALIALMFAVFSALQPASAQGLLPGFLGKFTPQDMFSEADRFGGPEGSPPLVPVLKGQDTLGYVFLNSDFSNSIGYSGKPIHMLVGVDKTGVIRSVKLVDHKEPIVLIGIPEAKVVASLNVLIGKDMKPVASGAEPAPQVDVVSGATVTVLVMGDSVVRSVTRLIRAGRIGGAAASGAAGPQAKRSVLRDTGAPADWQSLIGDGSVRRLVLSVGEVSDAFAAAGKPEAAANAETDQKQDQFIELYAAPVSIPAIGRSLLGEAGYSRLQSQLKPGQEAILVAGDGAYSFKGSGYVRGGIFDRIELVQDGQSTRFRDRNHTRLGDIAAPGAPALREIALFVIPEEFKLDLAEPWTLRLLVQRNVGVRDKAFLTYDLAYSLPTSYIREDVTPQQAPVASAQTPRADEPRPSAQPGLDAPSMDEPLWMKIWRGNLVNISIVVFALGVLTLIFFFQDWLVRRVTLYTWVRRIYLAFILVWLGWYANAQLSVVNVLTFTNSLIHGFSWEFFLAAPLIFILWAAVAAGLLFWGRGPFCGWLCPFGALQELLNTFAKWIRIPQYNVPWGLHERLWPIKYIIFLGLFGLSLYSVAMAEAFAEVEPFKTAIVLKFARDWPFTLYALTLLAAGLVIERFFCRYLCPLGAALAIPGRIRMFEWLKRWPECGTPCQRCAKECPVQSIHPEGPININECIYCMHCQELYHDDQRCPHMIQLRLKREKRDAMMSPSMRSDKGGHKPVFTHAGKPVADASPGAPPATSGE